MFGSATVMAVMAVTAVLAWSATAGLVAETGSAGSIPARRPPKGETNRLPRRGAGASKPLALAEALGQAIRRLPREVGGQKLLGGEAAMRRIRDCVVGAAIEREAQQRARRCFGQIELDIRHLDI